MLLFGITLLMGRTYRDALSQAITLKRRIELLLALPLTAAVLLQATPTQMGLLTAIELLPFLGIEPRGRGLPLLLGRQARARRQAAAADLLRKAVHQRAGEVGGGAQGGHADTASGQGETPRTGQARQVII